MGYPDTDAELAMLRRHGSGEPLNELDPVTTAARINDLVDVVRDVHVSNAVNRYALDLVAATRSSADLRLGASPRATLHLIRAAKATAALADRDYVIPEDVRSLAVPVLAHRVLPTAEAQISRRTPEQVVSSIVAGMPIPSSGD